MPAAAVPAAPVRAAPVKAAPTVEPTPTAEPAIIARARVAAAGAADGDALRAALTALDPGGLATTAGSFVAEDGNAATGLVLLGDVPGEAEDRSGKAFSGPAGQLLDRMLASIGLDRTHLLLAHVVPWRPPGGRAPSELEIACCLPFLARNLQLWQARRVVAMGAIATRAMLGSGTALAKVRGRWSDARLPGLNPIPVLPTHHPSQLLARPGLKAASWADLRALRRTILSG
jgi:DNA polymerase